MQAPFCCKLPPFTRQHTSSSIYYRQQQQQVSNSLLYIMTKDQGHHSASQITKSPPTKGLLRQLPGGTKQKYDGKQWRSVCTTPHVDCRNVQFRYGLCQKHYSVINNQKKYTHSRVVTATSSLIDSHNETLKRNLYGSQINRSTKKPEKKPAHPVSNVNHYDFDAEEASDSNDDQLVEDMDQSQTDDIHIVQTEYDDSDNAMDFGIEQISIKQERKTMPSSSNDLSKKPLVVPQQQTKSTDRNPRSTARSSIQFLTNGQNDDEIEIIGGKKAPLQSEEKTMHMIGLGVPPLTKTEEKLLCTQLTQHPQSSRWTFLDAELFAKKFACEAVKDNFNHDMEYISREWFYDFLMKNPPVVSTFKRWFERMKPIYPANGNSIEIKLWHLSVIARAPINI
ncbi:unnamed protein product [Didymodactylos carnosus]|uniref:Uncharacterized protein n=1 Tax=Didymodactylos carnosus TaxID=1234261 RepID=A0A8S2F245_9BILA|nr:unnamed protein product [Didymodactylos carnosus]CAF4131341.1 unnamed protein product [Didymodactylos carnosus]